MGDSQAASAYEPAGGSGPVVAAGEFGVAATHFDHAHLIGQIGGLREAGATVTVVYDPAPEKAELLAKLCPGARIAGTFEEVLEADDVSLVACAAIPDMRGPIGCEVMAAGKDYFADKCPFTSIDQLEEARRVTAETGRKFMVYYSERLHNDAAWHAGELIGQGAVGRVLQVVNLAPHRLAIETRPDWFFEKARHGGILTDIGSHQAEQFLAYTGVQDARVAHARVENFAHASKPELEDFGEMTLIAADGVSAYCRVDWFTPDGLPTWGDGRTFVLGTNGSIELRKTVDPSRAAPASRLYLTDANGEYEIDCLGKTGFPFFGRLILDCLERTDRAMTQEHAFFAAELSMQAQRVADEARRPG